MRPPEDTPLQDESLARLVLSDRSLAQTLGDTALWEATPGMYVHINALHYVLPDSDIPFRIGTDARSDAGVL
jgi:hypothetical protein